MTTAPAALTSKGSSGSVHSAPADAGSVSWSTVLALVAAARPTRRVQAAMAAVGVGEQAWKFVKQRREREAKARRYTVTIDEDDEVYPLLHRWLLEMIPESGRKALVVRTARGDDPIHVFYDGSREQRVEIEGHPVDVQVTKDTGNFDLGGGDRVSFGMGKARIVFTAHSDRGREAVLSFLVNASKQNSRSKPRLWVSQRWGGWSQRTELAGRALDTVILKAGQLEGLIDDLEWFLSAEADYKKMGLPWHRGYLFHGPPGTGKTSLAQALATRFDLDVYYVPLSDMSEDTQLLNMFAEISPRSLLLLEDIDVVHAAKNRDDDTTRKQVSLSGLLNALDGIATPHGMVTVMTTNDVDVLDPALIRAGRADTRLELGYLDDTQLASLVEFLLGQPAHLPSIEDRQLTPADIVGAIGPRGARDPDEAYRRLLEVLSA